MLTVGQGRGCYSGWMSIDTPPNRGAGTTGTSDTPTSKTQAPVTTPDTRALIRTIIGTGVGLATLLLMLIGLVVQQNANVNARIDDVHARMDDVVANANARFRDLNARFDDLREDIRELRALVIEALKRTEPAD